MMHPIFSRFSEVVTEHRKILDLPDSPTGRLTAIWAKVMVFPQMLAPVLILFGVPVLDATLIFFARFSAMHVVWLLDRYFPLTRALGLCHLVTFGPLFVYFTLQYSEIYNAWGALGFVFIFYFAVIAACLYMDTRDLILHLCNRPYPAYIRDHHRNGHINVDDPRVEEKVTVLNRIFW